jgi:agmatine deiminase
MPGEWEPHSATWIAWPHNRSDWPGKFASIPWVYAEIVRHLVRVEGVNILVNDESAEARARQVLIEAEVLPKNTEAPGSRSGNIKFWRIPTDRGWVRPHGDSMRGRNIATGSETLRFQLRSDAACRSPHGILKWKSVVSNAA